jgi:RNA polymerase sigma factor (sigma-70 family)
MRSKTNQNADNYAVIWNKFRMGDDASFSVLYEVYSDYLYRYGLKLMPDEEKLKDCIQDLFVSLYENRRNLPATDNVLFFILKTLRNRIVDVYRKEKRMVYIPSEELQFSANYYFDPEDDDSERDNEILEKLEKILNALNPRQKEAVYLRYRMNLSYDEMARILEINYQSARNLTHRAISKIRNEMNLSVFISLLY